MSTSKSNATAIVSIKDSKGEVHEGGVTPDTRVTVAGLAEPGTTVEVRDGTISKGNVATDVTGNWQMLIKGLAVSVHSITALAGGSVSAPRTFTVVEK
ncbi:hypothetical protein [Pseudomonas glycinae]|uniref:Bacterial Ig domain-containing protein n=1 Tax=Pseudomonas glycinae TaxID=1785145 RepID=A0ABM6QHJ1_9PSED|nr:hypothetical protein [Pseudomonas glycinae]AUG97417.1 hypothetical protein AWU82_28450 [Pseudomonas glycinae]